MPFEERVTDPSQIRYWPGSIPLEYWYSPGVAGLRFFRELKENSRLMATRCIKCKKSYLPPRIFCENCFARLEDWVEVDSQPYLYSWTAVDEKSEKSGEEKKLIGLVRFRGFQGGILHWIKPRDSTKLRIGAKLQAVFKYSAERRGSLQDILHFREL